MLMKKIFLPVVFLFIAAYAMAQDVQKAIFYAVSFPDAAHHEADIVMTIPDAPAREFKVQVSRSSALSLIHI